VLYNPNCLLSKTKHQADEEADKAALAEAENADLNADFVGEVRRKKIWSDLR
jgi:hypothetical protein